MMLFIESNIFLIIKILYIRTKYVLINKSIQHNVVNILNIYNYMLMCKNYLCKQFFAHPTLK